MQDWGAVPHASTKTYKPAKVGTTSIAKKSQKIAKNYKISDTTTINKFVYENLNQKCLELGIA